METHAANYQAVSLILKVLDVAEQLKNNLNRITRHSKTEQQHITQQGDETLLHITQTENSHSPQLRTRPAVRHAERQLQQLCDMIKDGHELTAHDLQSLKSALEQLRIAGLHSLAQLWVIRLQQVNNRLRLWHSPDPFAPEKPKRRFIVQSATNNDPTTTAPASQATYCDHVCGSNCQP